MSRSLSEKPHLTPEEYLTLERVAEFKSEYLDGQIYAMAGSSPEHSTITFNLSGEISPQLRGKGCRGFSNDMKVKTGEGGLYSYPDASIVCGEPVFYDDNGDVLTNPTIIFEVLSPTTEIFDRTKKFFRYQTIESFTDYILISQDEARIEHFIRQPDGGWLMYVVRGLENSLHISSIDCAISLANIYEGIEFPERESLPESE